MKSWITDSEEMLGVSEKQAESSAEGGTTSSDKKRQLCGRNDKTSSKGTEFPWSNCGS
jgi:hypothetical protein